MNVPRVIAVQQLLIEAAHRVLGSGDGLAQRMIFPEILREDLVDQVIGIVLIHLDLFQDHPALAPQIGEIEDRVQHQIAEHIHCNRQVLIQYFNVEADTFLGGECVHVAADGIHLPRNIFRRAGLGPFKDHVLQEMGDSVGRNVFVT